MARRIIKKSASEPTPKPQAMGCPTKYKPEYCKELFDYFNVAPYEKIAGREVATDYRSLNNFACKIGVNRNSLTNWAKEFPEFGEVYELAKQYQERYITINGLKSLIAPQFAQFIAINHIDMRVKAKDEAPDLVVNNVSAAKLSDEELDQAIEEREAKLKAGEK